MSEEVQFSPNGGQSDVSLKGMRWSGASGEVSLVISMEEGSVQVVEGRVIEEGGGGHDSPGEDFDDLIWFGGGGS